jgi:hypothetical protein
MKTDADAYAHEWAANFPEGADPEGDDSHVWEMAGDERDAFYQGLVELRDVTRLSIISGMFHKWEKELRDWISGELGRHAGERTRRAIWRCQFGCMMSFLETWQWPIKSRPFHKDLETCSLVVNVYKHGDGDSFDKLKGAAPDLLAAEEYCPEWLRRDPIYSDLRVTDDDLDRFSSAIISFWEDVPTDTHDEQIETVARWLRDALQKDEDERVGKQATWDQQPTR